MDFFVMMVLRGSCKQGTEIETEKKENEKKKNLRGGRKYSQVILVD